jgi:SnoaL-like protein
MRDAATAILHAFAHSDLDTIDRLCADDVLVWGTDVDEVWYGKQMVLAEFAGAFDILVRWVDEPVVRGAAVAGWAEFDEGEGEPLAVRVTMVFHEGLLTHAHYSIPA